MSRHKFEDYPELAEEMRNYASFNQFSSWQRFTDVLNNSLIEAENKGLRVNEEMIDQLMKEVKFISEILDTSSEILSDSFVNELNNRLDGMKSALKKAGVDL